MDHLAYGDLILLSGNEANEFLTALSFTDSTCFVQEVEALQDHNCRPMVFQVLPRLSYVNARALRHQTEGAHRQLLDVSKPQSLEEQAEYEKITNIAHSVVAEDKANERVIELRTAEPVRYGQLRTFCTAAVKLPCLARVATYASLSWQC
jgi:hypothetical protein